MLGYDIDFGYMEAIGLLSSNKFQEKLIVSASFSDNSLQINYNEFIQMKNN
jgi:hypothetical protein